MQFARKFYIAQWFRDCTTEAEKAMRSQNQKDDDSEGTHHAKELQATGDIMQRAETRKKFLHSVIKSTPNQFTTLRYLPYMNLCFSYVAHPVLIKTVI